MALTYTGPACKTCGTTERYESNRKCVCCLLNYSKQRFTKPKAKRDDLRIGLPNNFVEFGTTAHAILLYIHTNGPSTLSELQDATGRSDVSSNLTRLRRFGFLHIVSRAKPHPGLRSCAVYNTSKERDGCVPEPIKTNKQRKAEYRKRRRDKQLRVSSVFEFRGRIDL